MMSVAEHRHVALDITHLSEVIEALRRHSFLPTRYDRLGLSLGLLDSSLKIIGADYSNKEACLQECLSAWLRKADNVEDPTYETLIAALRAIGENAVADGIEEENFLPVYDGSGLAITNGEHAVKILNRHIRRLHQLRDTVDVATFLREERVAISEETMSDMTNYDHSLDERTKYLIRDVRKAVKQDYTKLRVFAGVCEKVTGNGDIGQAIMTDYDATFKNESLTPSELEESFKKVLLEFGREIKARNPSDKLLAKFKTFINNRYSIQIRTASKGISVIAKKCTNFDVMALEEATKELELTEVVEMSVNNHKETVRTANIEQFHLASTEPPLLDMEKLTITFKYSQSVCQMEHYQVEREHILDELFGDLARAVKTYSSRGNTITCIFPPTYATLLIKIILRKSEICMEKGIESITVGYAPVWDKQTQEIEQKLEGRVKSLKGLSTELEREVESLKVRLKSKEEQLQSAAKRNQEETSSLTLQLKTEQEKNKKLCLEKDKTDQRYKEDISLLTAQLKEREEHLQQIEQLRVHGRKTNDEADMTKNYKLISLTAADGGTSVHKSVPLFYPNNMTYDETSNRLTPNGEERSSLLSCSVGMELLANIHKPIAVLSIAGPAGTGKTYILSRLLDSHDAFGSQPPGIWIGTHALEYKDYVLVLLDIEGIDVVSGDFTEILVITLLMSSCFIYNTGGVPRPGDFEKLKMLMTAAQSAITSEHKNELEHHFPKLLWLLRDFTLKLYQRMTPKEYLRSSDTKSDLSQFDYFFPSFDVFTLPPPSDDPKVFGNVATRHEELEPEFTGKLKDLISLLRNDIATEFHSSKAINGQTLAQRVQQYNEALNSSDTSAALENILFATT